VEEEEEEENKKKKKEKRKVLKWPSIDPTFFDRPEDGGSTLFRKSGRELLFYRLQ
jgi:hypothetical protein